MLQNRVLRCLISNFFVLVSLPLAAQVAIPTAEYLPVTEGSIEERSVPLLSQADALAYWGYVEEEYVFSGTANVYGYVDNASNSPLVQVTQPDIPYATRVIVRRPANSRRFKGTVYFDILNATRGFDSDIVWHYSSQMIMREGAVYVGLTSKPVTVDFLRDAFGRPPYIPRNFSRYANLSMADDGQVWDMLSQAAALLKADAAPTNPLAGFGVERIILAGYSQSAGYIKTYVNSFHNDAILSDGSNAFDGYFEGAGSFASKKPDAPDSGNEFNPRGDPRNKTLLPVPAPVMRFQTSNEVRGVFASHVLRQTETDSPLIRTYEMAGGAHVDARQMVFEEQQNIDELGLESRWPLCDDPSTLRVEYVHSALLSRLDDWIQSGREPPPSRLMSLVPNAKGNLVAELDSDGNEVGGVRLPQLAVPTGVWTGLNPNLFCFLNGNYIPFSEAELAARYPSHRAYTGEVFRAVIDTYSEGYLLPQDGWEIYWDARMSNIARQRPRPRWWQWGERWRQRATR
jgi:hypothetical protein